MADLLKKMGGMGGMGDMGDMAKMAASMGLGGRNAKFNMGAMQSHLNQNMKTAQTKERMQQKLEQRRAAMVAAAQQAAQAAQAAQAQQSSPLVFSTGEKVERTPRVPTQSFGPAPELDTAEQKPTAPKKKNKNKK